jgi:hypothetical protein
MRTGIAVGWASAHHRNYPQPGFGGFCDRTGLGAGRPDNPDYPIKMFYRSMVHPPLIMRRKSALNVTIQPAQRSAPCRRRQISRRGRATS